jgi:hypothetical protein
MLAAELVVQCYVIFRMIEFHRMKFDQPGGPTDVSWSTLLLQNRSKYAAYLHGQALHPALNAGGLWISKSS